MLIRDSKRPYGYHVNRHPPRRFETITHWMLIAAAAFAVCLFLLYEIYSNT